MGKRKRQADTQTRDLFPTGHKWPAPKPPPPGKEDRARQLRAVIELWRHPTPHRHQ
jgi:hypothetical protein